MNKSKLELIDLLYVSQMHLRRYRYHLKTHQDRTPQDAVYSDNVLAHLTQIRNTIEELKETGAVVYQDCPMVPR